jgi:hypothetical protein
MTAAALPLRPLWSALRTSLRGAPVGFAGLLVLQAINLAVFWLFAVAAQPAARRLSAGLVVGHSWAAAFFGGLAGLLIAGRWLRQAQVVHGLRLPAAGRQMRRALLTGLGLTCLLTTLPPLGQVLLALVRDAATVAAPGTVPAQPGAPAWALLLQALAVPSAGILAGAAYLVLGDARWRQVVNLLSLGLVAFPWLLQHVTVPPALVGPAVVASSLAACASVVLLWRRLAWHGGLPQASPGLARARAGQRTRSAARAATDGMLANGSLAALVFPQAVSRKDDLLFAGAITALAAGITWWASLRWGSGMLLLSCLLATAVMPWIAGVWVSPRLPCLPGAPSRSGLQKFVLRQALQRGLRRLLLVAAGLLALAAFRGAPAGDVLAMAGLMAASGFWVASAAVASVPWRRSTGSEMWSIPWAALTALAAGLGWLLLRQPPGAQTLAPVAWQVSGWAAAAGCAVLLLSQGAWARLDWAHVRGQQWPAAALPRVQSGRAGP